MKYILAFFMFFATTAMAQQDPCGSFMAVQGNLHDRYGEAPTASGETPGGNLILVFSNPDTGSFSILLVNPQTGVACLRASGQAWSSVPVGSPT